MYHIACYYSNRRLGSIGLKYGASMILAHLKEAPSGGGYTLNVANTGLGDAILCHGSQVTTLTVPHNPATNWDEVIRVVKEKGFISEVRERRERGGEVNVCVCLAHKLFFLVCGKAVMLH